MSTNIETVRQLLEDETILHRTDLATRVCQQFRFYDARGQTQVSSCLKALRQLEQAGHFILPGVQQKRARKSPRRLPEAVSLPVDVPHEVGDVQDLGLVMVLCVFFFNDTATTEIYTLSLHDALPISFFSLA